MCPLQQLTEVHMPPKPHAPPPKGKPVAKKDDAADKKARKKDVAVAGSEDTGPERIKPSKQVQGLTDAELNKEITRVLSAKDPNAPDNVSRFSFKDRQFKLDAAVEQMFTHFEMEGCLVHKETEEGRRIQNEIDAEKSAAQRAKDNELVTAAGSADLYDREDDSKQLRNQFNFSERASQTFNQPLRERGTVTEPPPSISFCATATQWEIFDAYTEDINRQRLFKEKKQPNKKVDDTAEADEEVVTNARESDIVHSAAMSKSLKIIERMVNQNTYDEVAQDFKYWEDASDSYKEGEGTLLPLWKFYTDRVRRKHVTSMCWNPEYHDLFAVGYGSYDFMRQSNGLVCCWSLKNPTHPEFSFTTETGVMCLDFHPQHSSLLAVGLYDGSVLVFDIRLKQNRPIFQSTVKTGKHTDPVWQISWQEEDLAKNLNFFSISSDGRVTLWTMSKNELQYTDVMELKLVGLQKDSSAEEETSLCGLAGGCCFDFNKHSEHLFIVGTEEGKIHKCSKAYNSQYLDTFDGHHMAVYTVCWNSFHPRVFLSSSADWTVKVWDHSAKGALMSFDLGNSVGDVAWAPYSSTVFAAVTSDGKVHVFDLSENKHEPMCDQKVVKKAKLTHIRFNPVEPIIIVGDDRGCVNALKLSPNLRKATSKDDEKKGDGEKKDTDDKKKAAPARGKKDEDKDAVKGKEEEKKETPADIECKKLERILAFTENGSN